MTRPTQILLIDDDRHSREVVSERLRLDIPDVQIEPITSADDFTTALAASTVDLVITEYDVHWGNGETILAQIRRQHPHCPVIMHAQHKSEAVAVRMMDAGLDEYVIKSPEQTQRLVAAVRRALARRQEDDHHSGGTFAAVSPPQRGDNGATPDTSRLTVLHETALEFAAADGLHPLYQRIVERATRLVDADGAELYLCDDEQGEARCIAAYNSPHDCLDTTVDYGEGTVGRIATTAEPLYSHEHQRESGRTVTAGAPATAVLGIPLIRRDRVAGVVQVVASGEGNEFSQEDLETLTLLGDQAAIAIENVYLQGRVEQLSTTDALTGLHNRRYFFRMGEREVQRTLRYGVPLSVVVIDVDRFESIEETHGRQIGTRVLHRVADHLHRNSRNIDILARLEGETFGLLLGDTILGGACTLAERLRRIVDATSVAPDAGDLTVSVSVGVAAMHEGVEEFQQLLDYATQALSQAKDAGRNCMRIYRSD